jgi:hypothetical protein
MLAGRMATEALARPWPGNSSSARATAADGARCHRPMMNEPEPLPTSAVQHWASCPRQCELIHL